MTKKISTFGLRELKPIAELPTPVAGVHYVANGASSARQNMSAGPGLNTYRTRRYDFKLPPLLEDHEVEEILGKIDALIAGPMTSRIML